MVKFTLGHREILSLGLGLVKHKEDTTNGTLGDTRNIECFKAHYGASPIVVAKIFEDLKSVPPFPGASIEETTKHFAWIFIVGLLDAMRYLARRPTDAPFCVFPSWRKACWYHIESIQALKFKKVVFPACFPAEDEVMTVDGFRYSAKNGAGLCYELGIDLNNSNLIWMNGPFPADSSDEANFVEKGLKQKLKSIGKKALADKAYSGHPKEVGWLSALDSTAEKSKKRRAQHRHEKFCRMLKQFKCLEDQFCHDEKEFKICFEATAVICQYRMENGEALFNV